MDVNQFYDPELTLNKIKKYLKLDFKSLPYSTIKDELQKIYVIYNLLTIEISGMFIYRVRRIDKKDKHDTKEKVWCPRPNQVTERGRANDVNEAVFYASFDPITAIKEMNINENEKFSLIIYRINTNAKKRLFSRVIDTPDNNHETDKNMRITSAILSNFAFTEFSRRIEADTKYMYKTSCAIAHTLFFIPNTDAIIYNSVKDYNRYNIVIKDTAAENFLNLISVYQCKFKKENGLENIIVDLMKEAYFNSSENILKYKTIKHGKNHNLTYGSYTQGLDYNEIIRNEIKKNNVMI